MVQLDLLWCMWQCVADRAFKRVNLEKQLIEIQSQLTQHQSQLLRIRIHSFFSPRNLQYSQYAESTESGSRENRYQTKNQISSGHRDVNDLKK